MLTIQVFPKSSNYPVIQIFGPYMDQVVNAEGIIYYGLDFSKMVFTDQRKLGQDQRMRKFIPSWIYFFQKEVDPDFYIKKWLRKGDNFESELTEVQEKFNKGMDSWISSNKYSFNTDTLQMVINSYKLTKTEGIGFVINLENFNKEERYLTAYFTFFDIATRQILWATKIRSRPGGHGMTAYWGEGIRDGIKIYMDEVYFKSVKKQ